MFHHRRMALASLCGALCIAAALRAPSATAGDAKGLKYQFKPGESYTYRVTIVADVGDSVETYNGHISLNVKSADANETRLIPSVGLPRQVKTKPGARPRFPSPPLIGPPGFGSVREVTIDPYGNVVRSSGDTQLPLLLGPATGLVIEPLSAQGENRWQRATDINITEAQRMSPFSPFKSKNETSSTARETVTYDASGSGAAVKIKKTYELKTIAMENGVPRLQLVGGGEIVFDSQAGMAKSGSHKATITVNSNNVTVRIPITIEYNLLDAAAAAAFKKEQEENRAKAVEAAKKAQELQPAGDVEITKMLADIKSGRPGSGTIAAMKLSKTVPVEGRRDEVTAELEKQVKSPDGSMRMYCARALKVWGSDKHVPLLMGMLKDDNMLARQAAIEGLGGFKDSKAAEALAQEFPDFRVRQQASAALKAMGASAEKAVLPLLKHQDVFVRTEACNVLAEIGTNESVAALNAAAADTNGLVSNAAGKALKAIDGRRFR